MSLTLAANAAASSSSSSQPSSLRCEPQPDELTTTRSTSSNARTSSRANALPSSRRPAWTESAPQQPCGGATTSSPSAARTRAVAAVHVREDRRLHATREQSDAPAPRADRGRHIGHAAACAPRRRHRDERAEPPRHRYHSTERREPERGAHAPRIRKRPEEESAQEPVGGRAAVLLLDGVAGRLDQPVVADARGARREARHAPEAAIEVRRHGRVQRHRPVEPGVHEVDPTAWGVHLLVPEHVGGARRQAEAAVDAVGRELADHPPSVPFGSNARRIRSSSIASASADGPCVKLTLGLSSLTYATPAEGRTTALGGPSGARRARPGRSGHGSWPRPADHGSRPRSRRRHRLRRRAPARHRPGRPPPAASPRRAPRRDRGGGRRGRSARPGGRRAPRRRLRDRRSPRRASAAAFGSGCRRKLARAMSASRPREPQTSLLRS